MSDTVKIGSLAIAEHLAWKDRNAARKSFRDWCANYRRETDEYFDPSDVKHDPDILQEYKDLLALKEQAQCKLQVARAATRRAIRAMASQEQKAHRRAGKAD